MKRMSFAADRECRVDVLLSERTDLTRSAVKKLADEGNVTVNGKTVKAGQILRVGTEVEILIPDPEPICAVPEDIPV